MTPRDELRRLLDLAVWSYADAEKARRLVEKVAAPECWPPEQQGVGMSDRYEPAQDGDESGW
jgi:hypothetical protein